MFNASSASHMPVLRALSAAILLLVTCGRRQCIQAVGMQGSNSVLGLELLPFSTSGY
jgi:hypothetical protein